MIILVSKRQALLEKLKQIIPAPNIVFCDDNYLVAQSKSGFAYFQKEDKNNFRATFLPQTYSSVSQNGNVYEFEIELLLDKRTNKLSIQRDKIGFQHLYFSKIPAGILVSNSLKVISSARKLLGEVNSLSQQGLTSYLTFQYIPYTETIIKGVSQIPPGGELMIDRSLDFKVQTSWLKIPPRKDLEYNSISITKKNVKELLTRSLQKSVRGSRQVGCYLSGGMDTGTNVALLVKDLAINPMVFTASFAEFQYDELTDAKTISEKFALKHFVAKIVPKDTLQLPSIVDNFDSPVADRAILPQHSVTLLAKENNVEVMISGEGGDEIFGYPRRLSGKQTKKIANDNQTDNLRLANFYLRHAGLFTAKEVLRLTGQDEKVTYGNQMEKIYHSFPLAVKNRFDKIYFGQWKTWLIDNVLVKDKSVCEPMGIKSANPFVDIQTMKFMASLSTIDKLTLLRNKYLLRTMMTDYLPKKIIQKKKHKFHVPLAMWFREPLYEFLHESLLSPRSAVSSMFEKTFLHQLISNHKGGIQDNNRKLWALLFLEYWIHSFKKLEKSTEMIKYPN